MSNLYIVINYNNIICTKEENEIQNFIKTNTTNILIDLFINSYKVPESIQFAVVSNDNIKNILHDESVSTETEENISNSNNKPIEIKFKNIENISSNLKNIQNNSSDNFKKSLTICNPKIFDLDIYFIGVAINIVLFYMLKNSFYRQYISDIINIIPALFNDEKIPIISCLCNETFIYIESKLNYINTSNLIDDMDNIINNRVGSTLFKCIKLFWKDYKELFPKNISDIYDKLGLNISPPILMSLTNPNIDNINSYLNKEKKYSEKQYMDNFLKLNNIVITYLKMLDDSAENLEKLINGSDNKIRDITSSLRKEMQTSSDHIVNTTDIMTKKIVYCGEQEKGVYENNIKKISSNQENEFKQTILEITKNIIPEKMSAYEESLKFQLENMIEKHRNDSINIFNKLHEDNYEKLETEINGITINIAMLNERYERAYDKNSTFADLLNAQYNIIETKWGQIEEFENIINGQKETLDRQNKSINEQRRILSQQESTIRKNKKLIDIIVSNVEHINNMGKINNKTNKTGSQNVQLKINKLQNNLNIINNNMENFKSDTENKLNLMSTSIETILTIISK